MQLPNLAESPRTVSALIIILIIAAAIYAFTPTKHDHSSVETSNTVNETSDQQNRNLGDCGSYSDTSFGQVPARCVGHFIWSDEYQH